MTKNNLKLLDVDEHLRPMYTALHADLIAVARNYNFIVDCSTSDVALYIENHNGEVLGIG